MTGLRLAVRCWHCSPARILSHSQGILKVLVATDIDPEFGQQLVRDRPSLLLAYVGAEHEGTREPAIAFLKAVSGEDFGADLDAWTEWISR